eukprot:10532280-Heterocapsa_arctica.AAC.1
MASLVAAAVAAAFRNFAPQPAVPIVAVPIVKVKLPKVVAAPQHYKIASDAGDDPEVPDDDDGDDDDSASSYNDYDDGDEEAGGRTDSEGDGRVPYYGEQLADLPVLPRLRPLVPRTIALPSHSRFREKEE